VADELRRQADLFLELEDLVPLISRGADRGDVIDDEDDDEAEMAPAGASA